jgi:hypothetical protein
MKYEQGVVMKYFYTVALVGVIILPKIAVAQVPSECLHMNSRRITWNSTHTNGSFDVQWARSVKGPWQDTWDAMLGIPATNGVITVNAPHFFRVIYRELPGDAVGSYLGYRWNCYRTEWDIGKEWITSLPKPREGFDYGISGDGRGAVITTHEDDAIWKDYTVEFDLHYLGVDPSHNPYNLPLDYRGGFFMFRVQSMNETWNEATRTHYSFGFGPNGWGISRVNDYGYTLGGSSTSLLSDSEYSVDDTATNHVKIACVGSEISAWINDEFLGSVTDESDQALSHGGVGFFMYHESMMRFRNMVITHHDDEN